MKLKLLIIVLAALCMSGIVGGSTCGPNCLNSTETPEGPPCNETSGECLYGCIPGFTGEVCTVPCGENCLNCSVSGTTDNETVCNQCEQQHYKNVSQCEPCPTNCQSNATSTDSSCSQDDGRCTWGCKNNYFGDQCGLNCSSNCLDDVTSELSSCDRDSGHCSHGCAIGFHGEKCEIQCSNTCRQNDTTNGTECRQADGYCEAGCEEGWFSVQCNETCDVGCAAAVNTSSNATCVQDDGHCDFGCLYEYYGDTCSDSCSSHCQQNNASSRTCNETTGFCLFSCVDGHFGDKCDKQCSAGCVVKATTSSQNDTTGTSDLPICSPVNGTCTFGCDNSSYLANCTGNCSAHCVQNTSSDTRACNEIDGHCEFGCEQGYYGSRCDKQCHNNCLVNATFDLPTCDRLDGTCTFGCKDTHYGKTCNRDCSNKCRQSLCERDGVCSVGCSFPILGGPKCDQQCPKGCAGREPECDQQFHCPHGCKLDYWGPTCQPCSDDCTASTSPDTVAKCLVFDGFCEFGCSASKYGHTCSENCPGQCKDAICNQTTGECLNNCNKGHYGDYCNNTCSNNCPDNDCYPSNGTCVATDCLVSQYAWYGPSCNMKCPVNCKNKVCDRNTGHCLEGCVAGFSGDVCDKGCLEGTYGENCARDCSQGCINSTCEADSGECVCVDSYVGATCDNIEGTTPLPVKEQLPVVSGSIGGAAALLLIVGIVLLCVWRHRKKKQIVRRRKPKNRQAFSAIIRKTIFSTATIAGPRRMLVDNLLSRVKEMQITDFESDFNDIEGAKVDKPNDVAKSAENLSKNCFLDVYPFNENRVVLRALQQQVNVKSNRRTMDIIRELTEIATPDPDYINASFIEGYASSKQRYIAAQGPIAVTTNDFWKMIYQENVSVVVMLTEIEERGLFKQYWPDMGGQKKYGDVTIHCIKQEIFADFCLRRLKLKCFDETRPLMHIQYTAWPSDGVPPTSASMVEFYHKFLSVEPETDTPTVVHCTDGVGRTGCFIALDLSVDEGNEDHSVDVSQCVTRLREQRVNMVQSVEHYEFLYKTIAQVLCLRSYPVDKENLKKDWKELRKDDDKLLQVAYEDMGESVTLDEMDIESIIKNQGEEGKNRDGSDIPEDRYRPKLASGDYINAVYIDTYKKKGGIIVTQMPTPETVNQFLRLIIQEQCHVVVMMNEENAEDTSQFKYWPAYDKATQIGDVFVTTDEILDRVSYLSIKLTLSDLRQNDHSMRLRLFQFSSWKTGNSSPKSEVACLSLIRQVLGETGESYAGRILVHCLNGSERSGLFCSLYNLLEKLNYESAVSVVNTVRKIKSRRAKAVPDLEQFRFIYACLIYYIDNFEEDIKYQPDDSMRKRSKRLSQMYAKPDKGKNRKSQLYAKPDKKRKSELYSKPDKKRRSLFFGKADKKKNTTDERIEMVDELAPRRVGEQGASGSERAASGSGVQAVYAKVDIEVPSQSGSNGEVTVHDNKGYDETGQKSEDITVTIEQNIVDNVDDFNIPIVKNELTGEDK